MVLDGKMYEPYAHVYSIVACSGPFESCMLYKGEAAHTSRVSKNSTFYQFTLPQSGFWKNNR